MATTRGRKDPRDREARQQAVFDALRELLVRLGHEVTVTKGLEGPGGHCTVRGERRVIVSRRLPLSERIDVLLEIASREDLSTVDVPPALAGVLPAGTRAGER
jgi:hypothetical protein